MADMPNKLLYSIILDDVKESELCARYVDPTLTGLVNDSDDEIFFRWTDENTLDIKIGFSLSKRHPDTCITKLKDSN
ncbi:unnamed protein product [Cunninghamella echinulata]